MLKKQKAEKKKGGALAKKTAKEERPIVVARGILPANHSAQTAHAHPPPIKKNKRYLGKKDIAHFKKYFAEKKTQILGVINQTVDHLQSSSNNFPDQADRASIEEEFSLELRTRDRERNLLRKIEHSSHLLDTNSFGYCEACSQPIGRDRLRSRPEATLCIQCKSEREREEKQIHSGH